MADGSLTLKVMIYPHPLLAQSEASIIPRFTKRYEMFTLI